MGSGSPGESAASNESGGSGPGGGTGAGGGSGGSSGGSGKTPDRFVVAGADTGPDGAGRDLADVLLGASLALALDGFDWQIPGLVLSVPGLMVVVAVMLQLGGGLAWLPVIRRKLGTFGPARRRDAREA